MGNGFRHLAVGRLRQGCSMADEEAAGKLEVYRQRADELRRVADGVKNLDAKETILRIAIAYEHMARMLERFPGMLLPRDADPGKPETPSVAN